MCVCAPHLCLVPSEAKKRYWDPLELKFINDCDTHRVTARN